VLLFALFEMMPYTASTQAVDTLTERRVKILNHQTGGVLSMENRQQQHLYPSFVSANRR